MRFRRVKPKQSRQLAENQYGNRDSLSVFNPNALQRWILCPAVVGTLTVILQEQPSTSSVSSFRTTSPRVSALGRNFRPRNGAVTEDKEECAHEICHVDGSAAYLRRRHQ